MSVRVRFAPSPTGALHIGGLRTALYNYLFARKHHGAFLLRIEDTDQNRKVAGAENYIIKALEWMGLRTDEDPVQGGAYGPYRQSERSAIYKDYILQLIEQRKAYYAFDTPEALAELRDAAAAEGETFKYGAQNRLELHNSLNLDEATTEALLKTCKAVVRLKVEPGSRIALRDTVRGGMEINSDEIDDKILMKADGMPTYHFANVVDDHLMEITHVIRGEEWLPSLALHQLIYDAFGWEAPEFMHLPLILKPQGKGKLSKRDGDQLGFPVFPLAWENDKGFRERGFLPEALANYLALLGWNPGTEQEVFEMEDLIEAFDPSKIQKGGAKFDFEKARWFNHQFLGSADTKSIFERFPDFFNALPSFWSEKKRTAVYELLRERLFLLEDFNIQSEFFWKDPDVYDAKTIEKIRGKNPDQALLWFINLIDRGVPATEWKEATQAWNDSAGLPFGVIMQSLRLALVGHLSGPDIFKVCELLENEVILKRLKNLLTHLKK